jgi:hypothetical protein
MTHLDIDKPQIAHDAGVISKADRNSLLKMIAEKPSAIIESALRDAAKRGLFTDPLLVSTQTKSSSGRTFKSVALLALLLILGLAIFWAARHSALLFPEPRSVMETTASDPAKKTFQQTGQAEEVVVARLSENVRNVVKSHVPFVEPTPAAGTRCTAALKQRATEQLAALSTDKASSIMRPVESADRWIKRMTSLKDAGRIVELQDEAIKFRVAYPGVSLPKALRVAACIDP